MFQGPPGPPGPQGPPGPPGRDGIQGSPVSISLIVMLHLSLQTHVTESRLSPSKIYKNNLSVKRDKLSKTDWIRL